MSISVDLVDRGSIEYYFQNVCLGNPETFEKDLKSTSTPKFLKIKKALNIKASDKENSIKAILKEICKKGDSMTEEEQVTGEVQPDLVVEPASSEPIPFDGPQEGAPTHDYPVMQIKVDPELLKLVPRPSKENYETTKKSILERGMNDPIEVLPDGRIVDGHTRFQILTELGLLPVPPEKIKVMNLTEEEILAYMFDQNIARRHLSDIDKIEWAIRLMPVEEIKKEIKEKKEQKKKDTKAGKKEKEKKPVRVRDKIAKQAGVSGAQVERNDFLKKWAPEILEAEKAKKKPSIGNAYMRAKEMVADIKAQMPEVLDQITERVITLTDAHAALREKFPEVVKEKPLGPVAKRTLAIYELVTKKILVKKYGKADYSVDDEFWQELISRLDAMLQKDKDAGK